MDLYNLNPTATLVGLAVVVLIILIAFALKGKTHSPESDAVPGAAGLAVQSTVTASAITAAITAAVAEYRKNEEGVKNA